jgi:hypothetical protein
MTSTSRSPPPRPTYDASGPTIRTSLDEYPKSASKTDVARWLVVVLLIGPGSRRSAAAPIEHPTWYEPDLCPA